MSNRGFSAAPGGSGSAGALTTTATKISAYTAAKNELVPVDATGGAVTITLPTAVSAGVGGVVVVRKTDTSANPVSVARSGSDTINEAATSSTLSLALEVLTFTSDGTSKWTVSSGQKSLSSLDARYTQAVSLPYDVRLSGVVGDGTTDDTTALIAAVAVCSGASKRTLYIPAELNVKITAQVNAQFVRRINCEGTITVAYTGGPGLIIGDSSAQVNGCNYYFKRVAWSGVQTNVALRVLGLKGGRVTVEYCDYLQLWADNGNAATASMAYNDFFLGRAVKLEINGADSSSWVNENNFYGGRIDNLIIQGAYPHNNNTWHGCSIEGTTSTIQILTGSCNRVDCRGEGSPGPSVTFGSGTWANQVVGHYVSGSGVHATPLVLVSDGGVENILTSALDEKMSYVELIKIDKSVGLFDASSEWRATSPPVPGLDKLAVRSVNGQVLDTGIVPIRGTYAVDGGIGYYRNWSMLRFNVDSDTSLWRPQVYAYDSTGAQIDPSVTAFMQTTGGWTISGGGYTFGANVQFAQIILTSATVASIRIVVTSPSAVGTAFGYLRLLGYVPTPMPDTAAEQFKRSLTQPLYQAAAPAQGLTKPGARVGTATGNYTCVSRVDTTLTAQAAAAATTITVASITGIASGDLIGVLLDTGLTHWTTVSGAPSGTTVTLAVAMPSVAASGRAVGTNRWIVMTGTADTQSFTAAGSYTWTNPSPTVARVVLVRGMSAGSGGGSGRRGVAASLRTAGAGGAPGVPFEAYFLTTELPATVAVTVGAGGAGGAAVTADSTDGAAGATGGATLFGTYATTRVGGINNVSSAGGRGGNSTGAATGGTSAVGGPGGGGSSATGATGTSGGAYNLNAGGPLQPATGGGGGGGVTTLDAAGQGGAGGNYGAGTFVGGAGGATASAAGADGANGYGAFNGGFGGGGGAGGAGATGGNGGNGGFPAGGGGGGGASTNTFASGKGGNGADGFVRVVTFP